jgi:succinyl-CoA synthetase beta subunit
LLKRFKVPVSEGVLIEGTTDGTNFKTAEQIGAEAVAAVEKLKQFNPSVYVVKAQIHAGGRGKAGGVKVTKDAEGAKTAANTIMGKVLVTPQTGAEGKKVHKIYIEAGSDIKKEYYLGAVLDRSTSEVILMASTEGGMEIEEVAEKHPEKITRVGINPGTGYEPFHGLKLALALGLPTDLYKEANKFFKGIYEMFMQMDCAQVEINPMVVTTDNRLLALDAKVNFDDNALFRHPDVVAMRDILEENAQDVEASKYELAYIALDGTIGCLVNGAGLAMATLDIIKLAGGTPANFLDVGGGASKEKVSQAFKIILKDPKVKAILVNIFGGIMKCDVIAEGVIAAARELQLKVPLVVRLEGTNVELGKKMLSESGLKITSADDLQDAATKAVAAAAGA